MCLRFIKLFSVTILTTLLLSGCPAKRDVSSNADAVVKDNRPCMTNFSIEGSFWSGRTVKSFQNYPNSSKTPVFTYLISKLASIGYKIDSSNKEAGLISASFAVGFGKGATTTTNAIVSKNKPSGVRVDLTFIAAAGTAFGREDAQNEFCSILDGVPS